MLVLSRRVNEAICIGDGIVLKVLDINGKQVRIGLECSKDIPIHRKEIWDKIQQDKQKQTS